MADLNQYYIPPFGKGQAYIRIYFENADGYVKILTPYAAHRTVIIKDFTWVYSANCYHDDEAVWQWEIQREGYYPNTNNDFDTASGGEILIGTTNQDNKLGVGHMAYGEQQFKTLTISPFKMNTDDRLVLKVMRLKHEAGTHYYGNGLLSYTFFFN